MVCSLPAYLAQMSSRTFAVLHFHYRSFITTTTESAPYISSTTCPDFPSGFPESLLPLSILQSGVEFTLRLCSGQACSPEKIGAGNEMACTAFPDTRDRRCQLYPGCGVANIFRTSATLITDTTETTCFSHLNSLYRGFIVGAFFPRFGTGYSAPKYSPTGIFVPVFP